MNLTRTLLQHRWKAFYRSPALEQYLAAAIILGLFGLVFGVFLFAVGQNLDKLMAQLFPGRDPVTIIHRWLFYYLLFDLIGRYFVQGTPTASLGSYQHLPIRRAALLRFVLAQVPLTLFNALPWLVVGPFVATFIYPSFGFGAALGWVAAFGALLLISSYLVFLIRLLASVRPVWVVAALGAVVGLLLLDRFGLMSLSALSAAAFGALVAAPGWAAVPVLVLGILVTSTYRWLRQGLYAEDIPARVASSRLRRLNLDRLRRRYGVESLLLLNELKLITRHRRSRSALLSGLLLIIAYGLLFYTDEPELTLSNAVLIVPGIAITGSVMLTYGQLLFAWEGAYFDGLLTANLSFQTYLKSKHRLLTAFCLATYLFTLPFALLGWPILLVNTACFLFNGGVNSWLVIRFAANNRERVDMKSSSLFGWQGVSTMQLLLSFFTILVPLILGAVGNAIVPGGGVILLGVVGLAGWLLGRKWLPWVVRHLQKHKYALAAGLRHKSDQS
ncbi:MAG: DUF5687 family protein [Tunicatimonas sp.]